MSEVNKKILQVGELCDNNYWKKVVSLCHKENSTLEFALFLDTLDLIISSVRKLLPSVFTLYWSEIIVYTDWHVPLQGTQCIHFIYIVYILLNYLHTGVE